MEPIFKLINILEQIADNKLVDKVELVKNFQDKVRHDQSIKDERLNEILGTLAYDLDYYESIPEMRRQSPSYYGDMKLIEEVKDALKKIHMRIQVLSR